MFSHYVPAPEGELFTYELVDSVVGAVSKLEGGWFSVRIVDAELVRGGIGIFLGLEVLDHDGVAL